MSNGSTNPLKTEDDVRVWCQVHRAESSANWHNQEGINERLDGSMKDLEKRQRITENRGAKMGGVYLAAGGAIAVALQLCALFLKS